MGKVEESLGKNREIMVAERNGTNRSSDVIGQDKKSREFARESRGLLRV